VTGAAILLFVIALSLMADLTKKKTKQEKEKTL